MSLKQLFLVLLLLALVTTLLASSALFAQDNTVITFGVPDWVASSLDDEMFDEFEASNPGVSVVITSVNSELAYPTPPEYDIAAYLDSMAEYAATADVLFMTSYNLQVAATRAGYLLDLTPLIATDSTLNEADFFPAMWQSFQWDQGVWALPISGTFNLFIYRKDAFDDAGLPYPTEDWTFADFADTVRALTQRDENGEVTLPGFTSFGANYVLRSLLSQGFYDSSTFPEAPLLTDPELVALLDEWYALDQEGVFGGTGEQNWDFNEVPLTIQQPFNLMFSTDSDEFGGALLPGGFAGLELNAVSLSAGTEQPELAYELAKYITGDIELVEMLFGMMPARQSLVGVESENGIGILNIPDDVQALLDQAAMGALPVSELRFSGYIDQALSTMREDNVDAATALQEMEQQAVEDLQTAEARRDTTTIFVATPVPTPILSQNEIALRVNVNIFTSSLPDEEGWDQLIADFVAQDPDVGYVELSTGFDDFATLAEEQDCFYLPYNAISSSNNTLILSIDPFLDADFDFDPNDMAPGVMPQVQRDGRTYALPMTLQPQILWYDSEQFAEAGVFEPVNGWTVAEFEDALRSLQLSDDEDPPFSPGFGGGGYIMLLIAAYGGMPLDAVANPPIVNFNDPASIEAIRQVLDLAREGYLDYSELGSFTGGGGSFQQSPIYDDMISSFGFEFQASPDGEEENPYRLTTYPRGSQYTPVSYGIGTGYISATSQNPDACYRFLSALSRRPDLLGAMPARLSLIDDPAFAASQTPNALDFYRSFFDILQDPNLVVLPGNFGSGDQFPGVFVIQLWLFQAFDAYVLEDADLETELEQAQVFSENFLQCSADIPPFDEALYSTQEEQIDYFRQFARCAVLVDPETESLFGFIMEEDE